MGHLHSHNKRKGRLDPLNFLKDHHIEKLHSVLRIAKNEALVNRTHFTHIRDYYIILTLLSTGLRRFEICNLLIEHINIKEKELTVVNGKGGKSRTFPLTPGTVRLLLEYLEIKGSTLREPTSPNSPLFLSQHYKKYAPKSIYERVKYWFKKANLPAHLSTHSLRHTCCSILIERGHLPLKQVQEIMGHSDRETTELYIHVLRNGVPDIKFY